MSHLRSKITIPGKNIWNMNDATKRWETDSKQNQELQKCGRNFILAILMSSGKIRAISCFLSWKWKKISSVPFLCEIGFQVMHHVWITWYCCHPCCCCCCYCCSCCCSCCHCWCCSWPWKLGFVSSCYPLFIGDTVSLRIHLLVPFYFRMYFELMMVDSFLKSRFRSTKSLLLFAAQKPSIRRAWV